MAENKIYCFKSVYLHFEQARESQRLTAELLKQSNLDREEAAEWLLFFFFFKVERGTSSMQSMRTLMLLVGLLIVETFSLLQCTASGQASKQAARPAAISTSMKVSKASKEKLTGQAQTTKKTEDLMKRE